MRLAEVLQVTFAIHLSVFCGRVTTATLRRIFTGSSPTNAINGLTFPSLPARAIDATIWPHLFIKYWPTFVTILAVMQFASIQKLVRRSQMTQDVWIVELRQRRRAV
jgi:hypothetical protein